MKAQSRRAVPAMVDHPERGRSLLWVAPEVPYLVYTSTWVPDDAHPLGGYSGTAIRVRRVNLRKDEIPRYVRKRPLYEYVKEQS